MKNLVSALLCVAAVVAQEPLRVCATTPDLGVIATAIGGDRVAVTTFVRGPEDPHFLEPRPSMVRALSKADVLIEVGRELEVGWLPVLVDNARNGAVLTGKPGRIVAADVVRVLGVPTGPVDRSRGDVHLAGNPHFLADPLCGLQLAALLRERFAALRPDDAARFGDNLRGFRRRLCEALVGKEVAGLYEYEAEKLAELFAAGRLEAMLQEHGDGDKLAGWCAALGRLRGMAVVADHDLWPYFAERFGVQVVGFCEPRPGIPPTSAHLEQLVATMRRDHVQVMVTTPSFAPQHAAFLVRATSARVAAFAHQAGALPGTEDYVDFVDHNVRALVAAATGKP